MITNDVPDTVIELFNKWIKDEVGTMNAAFYYGALRQGFIAGYYAGFDQALNNKPKEDNDD